MTNIRFILLAGILISCLLLSSVSASAMNSLYTKATPETGHASLFYHALSPDEIYLVHPSSSNFSEKKTEINLKTTGSLLIPGGKATFFASTPPQSVRNYESSPVTVGSLSTLVPPKKTTGGKVITTSEPASEEGKDSTTSEDSTATGTTKKESSGTEYDYDVTAGLDMDTKCAPMEVVLTDKSSASGGLYPTAWEWDLGDGTTLSGESVTHTYDKPGRYTLKETVTFSDNHVVEGPPATLEVAECGSEEPPCSGIPECGGISPQIIQNEDPAPKGNVEFSVAPTVTDDCGKELPVSVLWDFGDGETSTEPSGTHYYKNPGAYTGTFTVNNPSDCSSAGTTWDITIPVPKERTVAEEPKEETFCRDTCWDNGPTVEELPNSPIILSAAAPTGSGDRAVASTEKDRAVLAETEKGIPISTDLDYESGFSYPGTSGEDNPDGQQSSGSVTISYWADYGGAHFCSDGSYTPSEFEYLWDFGDGTTSSDPSGTHTYTSPGDYEVRMTATPKGESSCPGFDGTVDTIHVSGPPEYTFDFSADPLSGDAPLAVRFSDHSYSMQDGTKSEPIAWDWSLGEGTTKTKKQFTHVFQDTGSYPVTLVVTYTDGTTKSGTKTITVSEPKDRICETYYHAELVPDKTGGEAELSVQFTDASYATCGVTVVSTLTDTGNGNTYETPSFSTTYTKPGIYPVEHTVTFSDKHQETVYGTITVTGTIYHNIFNKVDPKEGPRPLEVTGVDHSRATNGVVPVRWSWEFGDGKTGTGKVISHTYSEPGTYDVTETVTFSDGFKDDSEVVSVTVTGKITGGWEMEETGTSGEKERTVSCVPDWEASATGSPLSGPAELSVEFEDQSYASCDITPTSWDWDFGDGQTGSGKTVTHTFTDPGSYEVTETVTFSDKTTLEAEPISVIVGEEEKEGVETGSWEITEKKGGTETVDRKEVSEEIPHLEHQTELGPLMEKPPLHLPLVVTSEIPPLPAEPTTIVPYGYSPGQSQTSECIEQEIFDKTNEAYTGGDYVWDNELVAIARAHSKNMCDTQTFDHTIDGKLPWDRLNDAGYGWFGVGENIIIACGTDCESVAADAMARWMTSNGHRANIMNEDPDTGANQGRTNIGVGVYQCQNCPSSPQCGGRCCGGNACYLITQVFTKPSGSSGKDNTMPGADNTQPTWVESTTANGDISDLSISGSNEKVISFAVPIEDDNNNQNLLPPGNNPPADEGDEDLKLEAPSIHDRDWITIPKLNLSYLNDDDDGTHTYKDQEKW